MGATSYEIAGRSVAMPCVVRDASAGTVMYEVDAGTAAGLVPEGFRLVESAPGRAQLNLAIIDYRNNDLGDYREVGVTLFVTPAGAPDDEAGTFITHLPVDQQFTCEAGRTIWGFPKTVEQIDLDYADDAVTATLHMDGALVFELTLPRGGSDEMPQLPMTTYTVIGGVPHATAFSQGGSGSQVLGGGDGVSLTLGDHPLAKELAGLGLPSSPQLTTWTERMQGTFEAPEPLA